MTDVAMARAEQAISSAQRRAERIRVGMHSFIATRREIAAAYTERDWVTLGYESFDAYVDSEFSDTRLRLSPDERRDAVTELRRAGMSQRAIGTALGVDAATVNRDLRTVADATVPDRITGTDGREQPATRPAVERTPSPESADAAHVPPAGPVSTTPKPAPREEAKPASPESPDLGQLKSEMARESERRTAIGNLSRVLTYLTSTAISPAELARNDYAIAVDQFTGEDLLFAAETMSAIAALKEQ